MGKNNLAIGLRRSFGAGLLVIVPVLLTIWIIVQLFNLFSGVLDGPLTLLIGGTESLEAPMPLLSWAGVKVGHLVPLMSLVALVVTILLLGVVARNVLGARVLAFGERVLIRIPIIRRVYMAVSQISETFLGEKKGAFQRAVMFEYPREGMWSVGFVTSDSGGELPTGLEEDSYYHIFLPTTPNPTSGFMLVIPKEQCVDLGVPVEDALKLIISGGAVSLEKPPGAPASEEE